MHVQSPDFKPNLMSHFRIFVFCVNKSFIVHWNLKNPLYLDLTIPISAAFLIAEPNPAIILHIELPLTLTVVA